MSCIDGGCGMNALGQPFAVEPRPGKHGFTNPQFARGAGVLLPPVPPLSHIERARNRGGGPARIEIGLQVDTIAARHHKTSLQIFVEGPLLPASTPLAPTRLASPYLHTQPEYYFRACLHTSAFEAWQSCLSRREHPSSRRALAACLRSVIHVREGTHGFDRPAAGDASCSSRRRRASLMMRMTSSSKVFGVGDIGILLIHFLDQMCRWVPAVVVVGCKHKHARFVKPYGTGQTLGRSSGPYSLRKIVHDGSPSPFLSLPRGARRGSP